MTRALQGDGAICGTSFKAGEEALYIAYDGRINLCGRLAPREDLLRRLREFKR